MPITLLNRMRGGGDRAFDADVLSWRDAVIANGGSVSLARLIVVDRFVFNEKASGTWALTDDYLGFWAENAAQALTSLKQRRLATAINSPVFTQDRDFTFDGATSYIDTGFVPDTMRSRMATSNLHAEIWERTSLGSVSGSSSMGVSSGSSRAIRINPLNAGGVISAANGTTAICTLPVATSVGLSQVGRNGPLMTDSSGSKNGVAMTRTQDLTSLGASLPSHYPSTSGQNTLGAYGAGEPHPLAMSHGAQPLAVLNVSPGYNAVQAWATSVGAQV